MASRDKSLSAQIERLARETSAPESFVKRIQGLFSKKGISLESDGTPYLAALEQAFRKEQSIRNTAVEARRNLQRLHRDLVRFTEAFKQQAVRLRGIRQTLQHGERSYRLVERTERFTHGAAGKGFLVPGPDDLQ